MSDTRVVAIGLLTERDLHRLGASFHGAIPIVEDGRFDDLLARLDEIEVRQLGEGIVIRPEVKS